MTGVTLHRLSTASIEGARIERAAKVAAMAKILLRDGTYADENEARRSLMGRFPSFEVHKLLDDARQVAMQHCVEIEMMAP